MQYTFKVTVFLIIALALSRITSSFADGILIPSPLPLLPHPQPLSVKYHRVKVRIDKGIAHTTVDQVFVNNNDSALEGTYLFPLPEDAAISDFAMFTDGKRMTGELLEKDKARKIYEDIVRTLRDPALLEYVGRGVFQARVFPIPARGEKRIQLEYAQLIKTDNSVSRYQYPLNTEKFSPTPLQEVSLSVEIKSEQALKSVYSPSHALEIKRIDEGNVRASFEQKNVKPSQDFVLYYSVSPDRVGMSLIAHRKNGQDGYFLLLISPRQEIQEKEIEGKDIVFVCDTSGSMEDDEKLAQAKRALSFCLGNLNREDCFGLVTFSSEVRKFSETLLPATTSNLESAKLFLGETKPRGGTDINSALVEAMRIVDRPAIRVPEAKSRPKFLVFLTDGLPTVGETEEDTILKNTLKANPRESIRLFSYGVGYDVNTHLLDKLSEQNHGSSDYIAPKEEMEVKISNFYQKIAYPVLADLELDFGNLKVTDVYPKHLPDLFKGSQIAVFGRYKGEGSIPLQLLGSVLGRRQQLGIKVSLPSLEPGNDFIPRLWATRKIGTLLDEMRLHGDNKELKDEVVKLSLEFGIMTPYTSFLVQEDEKLRVDRPQIGAGASGAPSPAESVTATGKSGAGAVRASSAMRTMKDKEVLVETTETDQIKHVGGRTFFLHEGIWTDSTYARTLSTIKVKYLSAAYFQLTRDCPTLGKFLALGDQLILCLDTKALQIDSTGLEAPQGKEWAHVKEMIVSPWK